MGLLLVRVLQKKNRTNRIYVDLFEEIYYRNWLTELWRLRNPTICHFQAGKPGQLVV